VKAIFYSKFGERDVLEFGEMASPVLPERHLLIQVERSSVNYVDIRERQGIYNRRETHGGEIKPPHIPGLQAVGIVTAAGSPSDSSWIGKKVLAYTPKGGGYAQLVAAETNFCIEIPESQEVDLFAALPNQGLTAYLLLTASTKNGSR
jgi:NADPH:quinone reductase